jgi:hypothetical protein
MEAIETKKCSQFIKLGALFMRTMEREGQKPTQRNHCFNKENPKI